MPNRNKNRRRQLDARPALAQVPLSHPPDFLQERLLYRDAMVLVIDKPAGLAVHAGPKGGETLAHYLDGLRFGLPARPELGHRLDRDTSGCLALGRHKKALRRLGQMFQAGVVQKIYWAIVQGKPDPPQGRIEMALSKRSTAARGWWMQTDPSGQKAVTDYRLVDTDGEISLIELQPQTGRTHQLRVHMAHLGHSILGDPVYGHAHGEPLMLHAKALRLPLYLNKPAIDAVAPIPDRLARLARRRGLKWPDRSNS